MAASPAAASQERFGSAGRNGVKLPPAIAENLLPAGLFAGLASWQVLTSLDIWPAAGADWSLFWLLAPRVSNTLFLGLVAALFLVRRPRQGPRATKARTAVALAGACLPSLLMLGPSDAAGPMLAGAGVIVMLCGAAWTIGSVAALGASFGLLPEVRGLTTAGPYRYVRHPIYLGEVVTLLGAVLPRPSLFSLGLLATFATLQYWRAINEELALQAAFVEYGAYAGRTWRIVPGLH